MTETFADKDRQLIRMLQENARTPVSELAREMNVSRTAAQARLEKLENNGTIAGYGVRLGAAYRDNQVKALVMIKSPARSRGPVEKHLSTLDALSELHSISGAFDLVAVLSAANVNDLDRFIDAIGHIDGVQDTMSSIILSTKVDREI